MDWQWLISALIGASGVWVGHFARGRTAKREAETARIAAETGRMAAEDARANSVIDQLQEELRVYREDAGRRATLQDERLNRLEITNDGYRAHIHDLRAHIWDGLGPPPPAWPADLPR